MQCPRCGFLILPDALECSRCGHDAHSQPRSSGPLNVHPPRASKLKKTWRSLRHLYRAWQFVESKGEALHSFPSVAMAAFSIIPGLGHLIAGKKRFAGLFFGSWSFFFLIIVFFWGYTLAQVCIFGLLFCHVYCICDISRSWLLRYPVRQRLGISLIISIVLLFLIYWPLHAFRRQIIDDIVISQDLACDTWSAGEVVLVNRYFCDKRQLHRGDLALYAIESQFLSPRGNDGYFIGEGYFVVGGRVMDRILGIAGDTVEFAPEGILVNGELLPVGEGPLNPQAVPHQGKFVVPADHYFIFPSQMRIYDNRNNRTWQAQSFQLQQSMVPFARVQGKVFMVYYPLSQRRFL